MYGAITEGFNIDAGGLTSRYHQDHVCIRIVGRHELNRVSQTLLDLFDSFHPIILGSTTATVFQSYLQLR